MRERKLDDDDDDGNGGRGVDELESSLAWLSSSSCHQSPLLTLARRGPSRELRDQKVQTNHFDILPALGNPKNCCHPRSIERPSTATISSWRLYLSASRSRCSWPLLSEAGGRAGF